MMNLILEFIGTFLLLLSIVYVVHNKYSKLQLSITIGIVLTLLLFNISYLGGHAHLNPTISLAMFVNNKINLNECLTYILAQFLAGLLAMQVSSL